MSLSLSLGLGLTSYRGGGAPFPVSPPASLFALKKAIVAATSDVTALFVGDSTGNDVSEWIYRVAQGLATRYPTHSVDYALWNNTTDAYSTPTVVSTGSGPRTIHIANASIAGANLNTLRGSKFGPAIADLDPDLIIISLGHNTTGWNATPSVHRGNFMALLEQIMLAHPGVPIAMVLQNPRRDTDLMAPVIAVQRYIQALRRELTLIDVYSDFMALGKAAYLYADDTHPSSNNPGNDGHTLYTDRFLADFDASYGELPAGAFTAWLTNRAAAAVSVNSDFAAFAGAVPDAFTVQGTGYVLDKDTVVKAPGKSYSVKLVNGSTSTHIRQHYTSSFRPDAFDAMRAAGKATIAIHQRISSDGPPSNGTGRVRLLVEPPTGGGVAQDNPGVLGLDGWRWDIISGVDVPQDVSLVWMMAHPNTSAELGIGTINIDEMWIFPGEIPGARA